MSQLDHALFNLIANSAVTFLLTLGLVYGTLRAFRIAQGRCRLWLLTLPFAKVLLDLSAGVPASSFLWARLAGHAQDLGSFRLGFGLSRFVMPTITFELGAYSDGLVYPQSLGDVLDAGLSRHIGSWFPGALAGLVLLLGFARLQLRWRRSRAFFQDVLRDTRVVDRRWLGRQRVEVLVSERHTGVPFAAGIVRPRIVLSHSAAFTPDEREAVLQHELAHIAHHDLALLAVLGIFEDLFWFLPLGRGLSRRIQGVLEQRADDAALAAGAQPLALASALVRAGEVLHGSTPGAAILAHRSLLELRVHRLLQTAPASRRSALIQIAIAVLVTVTVAQALFFGNHASALVRFPIP